MNLRNKINFGVFFGAVFCVTAVFAQEPEVEEETTEDIQPGIVFIKPPDRPLLGIGVNEEPDEVETPEDVEAVEPVSSQPLGITPINNDAIEADILASIEDPAVADLLNAMSLSVGTIGVGPRYAVKLEGAGVDMPTELAGGLSIISESFTRIDYFELDMIATTSREWTPGSISNGSLNLTKLEVANIALLWGGISFYGDGNLDVDAGGILNGTLKVTVTSWNSKVRLAQFLGRGGAFEIDVLLGVLTSGDELTFDVKFANGEVKIGNQVLANVPPLTL